MSDYITPQINPYDSPCPAAVFLRVSFVYHFPSESLGELVKKHPLEPYSISELELKVGYCVPAHVNVCIAT